MIAAQAFGLVPVLIFPLAFLFILLLLQVLLLKQWAAAFAFVLLCAMVSVLDSPDVPLYLSIPYSLIYWGLLVFAMIRFGLLAVVAQGFFWGFLWTVPLTTQGSAWYAGASLTGILLMAAMAFYGFYTSLGSRPIFGAAVLEE